MKRGVGVQRHPQGSSRARARPSGTMTRACCASCACMTCRQGLWRAMRVQWPPGYRLEDRRWQSHTLERGAAAAGLTPIGQHDVRDAARPAQERAPQERPVPVALQAGSGEVRKDERQRLRACEGRPPRLNPHHACPHPIPHARTMHTRARAALQRRRQRSPPGKVFSGLLPPPLHMPCQQHGTTYITVHMCSARLAV